LAKKYDTKTYGSLKEGKTGREMGEEYNSGEGLGGGFKGQGEKKDAELPKTGGGNFEKKKWGRPFGQSVKKGSNTPAIH